VQQIGPSCVEVRENWSAPPGLVEGFRFRLLDSPSPELLVTHYDPHTHAMELSAALSGQVGGAAFEIASDEEAPVLAARLLTGTPAAEPLPPSWMRLATTLGTNTLLQRSGAPTALFITAGFGQLLEIGNQQRPDLFALNVQKAAPLYSVSIEVAERIAADGRVLEPLDLVALEEQARATLKRGIRVAAVALLHSYRNPEHEVLLAEKLLEWGFGRVSRSSELAARIKIVPRAETTVVDAFLSPVVSSYVDRVRACCTDVDLQVMSSAGGLLKAEQFHPKDSLLSGPAGGVVGSALSGQRSGFDHTISFDMGGTSTDVARYDGDYEYTYEHQVGDAHLVAPALAIESVAAGGGSICWLDGQRLRVGPMSAGALPGPACYGAGGPLTITDVNLLMGRLDPRRFEIPIQIEPARRRFEEIRNALAQHSGEQTATEPLLEGLLAIGDETMADAIRSVSLRRGYDPAEYTLVAFGGAGGQHACGVAARLGMKTIVIPPDASLLSAYGLGHAVVERFAERQVLRPLKAVASDLPEWIDELTAEATAALVVSGVQNTEIETRRRMLHLRFSGQETTVEIEWQPQLDIRKTFEDRYEALYGHRPAQREIEVESIRVVASSVGTDETVRTAAHTPSEPQPDTTVRGWFAGSWREIPGFDRDGLRPGARIKGPALITERRSTTVVDSGWVATVDAHKALVLEREMIAQQAGIEERPEAIRLELFTQRFNTLVREMGERLERTAVSTNVKERLDFSCTLLNPLGELVVNAPHMPVHLGAIGLCVRRLKEVISMSPGDVVVTNHPAYGGSHLPDITVVTPVFSPTDPGRLLGYVASRAHHAEIGGIRPGSMPPDARVLAEEGVVISPFHLIEAGVAHWDRIKKLLEDSPLPTRCVADNLADLRAAIAANHSGVCALQSMANSCGDDVVAHYMDQLERLAEQRIREALSRIPDGTYQASERLDDGAVIAVRIELSGDQAHIDFTGSASVHPGNLNATPAIVQSAVIYVLRLLLHEPLPLNEGLLRAVTITVPPGLLNPYFPDDPKRAPAVVGGNVETSQRLVDTLLAALGIVACSQGTMNNLIFGDAHYGYYETLGGGCGAGPDFHGASAVHSHMTNTRITDPEIIEHRYPVRVRRFAIREGSGGAGRFKGGDGLIREIEFLKPATLSILSQHRHEQPYGLHGGQPGARGQQQVIRADGTKLTLTSIDGCEMAAGDRLILKTPGGGGYGET
jgi:5-oxoprolinase (ATP-hydrolysing)